MIRTLSLTAALLLAAPAIADDTKPQSDPPGVPVEAKLVAKKATYKLDLGGKTPEEYRALLKEGGGGPPPPEVDLALELTNKSDKEIKVWIGGDPTQVMVDLKGKGAVTVKGAGSFTLEFRSPREVTLAAGKSTSLPVTFKHGMRNVGQFSYWTEPGEYTVTVRYQTAVSPAPKGAKDAGEGFGRVLLTSSPVTLKVEK